MGSRDVRQAVINKQGCGVLIMTARPWSPMGHSQLSAKFLLLAASYMHVCCLNNKKRTSERFVLNLILRGVY